MIKLEEKLIKLGYKQYEYFMLIHSFVKTYNDKWNLTIETNGDETRVVEGYIDLDEIAIYTQRDIDDLQKAYNILQQDLKVLEDD